jgi:hypothetical protein
VNDASANIEPSIDYYAQLIITTLVGVVGCSHFISLFLRLSVAVVHGVDNRLFIEMLCVDDQL